MLSRLEIARLWGVLLAVAFLPSAPCIPSNHVVATFVDPLGDNTTVNNHLVVHKETGILYVGAVNRIYQLDPNLRLLAFNKTGPYEDSLECSGFRECPMKTKVQLTNNVNKALVVDYSRAKLIACGSLYQGICWILGLDNVSTSESDVIGEPIAANNETASTVAFIAPGPPSPPTTTVRFLLIFIDHNHITQWQKWARDLCRLFMGLLLSQIIINQIFSKSKNVSDILHWIGNLRRSYVHRQLTISSRSSSSFQ